MMLTFSSPCLCAYFVGFVEWILWQKNDYHRFYEKEPKVLVMKLTFWSKGKYTNKNVKHADSNRITVVDNFFSCFFGSILKIKITIQPYIFWI